MSKAAPHRMTFDQLQRYRLSAELIEELRDKRPLRVLDAGSREGFLRSFLPGDMIINLDREIFPIDNFIQGDILRLPFPDAALDVALALDVLEHVPAARRPALLDEIARVSKDLFIVGSPFHDEKVEDAEKIVNEFCLKVTGRENEFLIEHLTEGLPRLDEVLEWARRKKYQTAVLPNAYLYRWTLMMCLNEYLSRLAEPWDVIFGANDFYHRRFYREDNSEPAYRRIIVGRKSGEINSPGLREKFAARTAEDIDPGLLISFMEKLIGEIDSEKDNAIEKIQREKLAAQKKLKSEVDKLTKIIDEKTRSNTELEKRLASEVKKLTGANSELRAQLDAEVKKLTGIIDEKSKDIIELHQWARNLQGELDRIRSNWAYRILKKISDRFPSTGS